MESDLALARLSLDEQGALEQARRSIRVTRLDPIHSKSARVRSDATCVSLAIRDGGDRTATCLVWVDRNLVSGFVNMMQDLQTGLQMAMRRIRDAEARAVSARRLAHRVSEELKTPVGALTHAIDHLRGEAERLGLDSEWVERVTSESQRVVRAMQHVEDELRQKSVPQASTST